LFLSLQNSNLGFRPEARLIQHPAPPLSFENPISIYNTFFHPSTLFLALLGSHAFGVGWGLDEMVLDGRDVKRRA
jgi:hypothetical protein